MTNGGLQHQETKKKDARTRSDSARVEMHGGLPRSTSGGTVGRVGRDTGVRVQEYTRIKQYESFSGTWDAEG
jgi:hypothetical protein